MTSIIEVNADYDIKGDLRYRFEDRNSDSTDISDKSRERINSCKNWRLWRHYRNHVIWNKISIWWG